MSVRIPKYRHHKPTGQALVEIRGRRIYLGRHGTEESREKYRRIIAQFVTGEGEISAVEPKAELTVNEVILRYFRFAETYYVKHEKPTDEVAALRAILKRLRSLYGHTPVSGFGPKAFKILRDSLILEGLSRKYINDCMARVRRIFRWAAAEELVPASIYQALASVPGLRRGRSKARETKRILPVSAERIEAILPELPEVVADMVRMQRLTGMRPAEVCILRPCDIDRTGEVWRFVPESHKTEHFGRERVIFIGPKAQEVLLRYLARDSQAYCFRPCDSEAKRRAEAHAERKTPLEYGNRPGTNRKGNSKRKPGEKYNTNSYRKAIHRACDKSGVKRWSPNRLRHAAATEIRREYGLEAAQIILGHSAADITQVYAERDLFKGLKVAKEIG